ncbi:MAG: methyl-accepting chemotaxis protein [Chloroflexota bacterium]|nr:methyl-accepting chemotaxis protein [Chloroflexota bacterium]
MNLKLNVRQYGKELGMASQQHKRKPLDGDPSFRRQVIKDHSVNPASSDQEELINQTPTRPVRLRRQVDKNQMITNNNQLSNSIFTSTGGTLFLLFLIVTTAIVFILAGSGSGYLGNTLGSGTTMDYLFVIGMIGGGSIVLTALLYTFVGWSLLTKIWLVILPVCVVLVLMGFALAQEELSAGVVIGSFIGAIGGIGLAFMLLNKILLLPFQRAQQEAAERAEYLNQVPTPILAMDNDLNIRFINAAGAGMIGKDQEDCIGLPCSSLCNTTLCRTSKCLASKAMVQNAALTHDTVARTRSGNLPLRCTSAPIRDQDGDIVGALEFMQDISSETRAVNGIMNLVQQASEGHLDARANTEGYEGNFLSIAQGVNATLDAIIDPLTMTAEYINRISKGDIPEKLTQDYHGNFGEIKDNLNQCIDSINGLVIESQRITEAAVEGSLEVRGDTSNFHGEYANIVSGINRTVDTLVGHINSIPSPAVIIDRDFTITYINQAGWNMTGMSQASMIGKKCYDVFRTSHCNTPSCACSKAMSSGKSETGETIAQPRDHQLSIAYTGVPLRDQYGSVVGVFKIITDQTRIKEAMEDAQRKVDYLNSIPSPVTVIDRDFEIQFINDQGAKALGRTVASCIGQKCFSLFDMPHCNTSECRSKQAIAKDSIFTSETISHGMRDLPVQYTGVPLKDTQGNIIGALEYVTDIKELKDQQSYLERSMANINEAMQELAVGSLDLDLQKERDDEIGQVVDAMEELVKATQGMANIAEKLSNGNINVDVEPRSDRDVLGIAFTNMVDYMQEMARQADLIANGDLTSGIQAKSDQDVLGNSFITMQFNLREIIGKLKESADRLGSASEQLSVTAEQTGESIDQIASISTQIAKSATEQARGLQNTSESMNDLAEVIERITDSSVEQDSGIRDTTEIVNSVREYAVRMVSNAQNVAQSANQSAEQAREGVEIAQMTMDGMTRIKSSVDTVSEKVLQLGERSTEIGKIVNVIDDIAAQTNLLALNAAIEAARAGEQGRGFAVVSDEVRKLAERTASATKEISELIEGVQGSVGESISAMEEGATEVESGFKLASDIGSALTHINSATDSVNIQVTDIVEDIRQMTEAADNMVRSVKLVSDSVEHNSTAAQQMSVSSSQVGVAVESVAAIAQEHSASTQEVSATAQEVSAQIQQVVASSEELSNVAQDLMEMVTTFNVKNINLSIDKKNSNQVRRTIHQR